MKIFLFFTLLSTLLFSSVDINNATLEELMTLEDIGKKKAKSIIKRRNKKCFRSVDELTKVRCITKKTIKKNKDNLTATGCNRPKKENKKKKEKKKKKVKQNEEEENIENNEDDDE